MDVPPAPEAALGDLARRVFHDIQSIRAPCGNLVLPRIELDDRTLFGDTFSVRLRNLRFELLRSGQYEQLGRLLKQLLAQAETAGDRPLAAVASILIRHNAWQTSGHGLLPVRTNVADSADRGEWAVLDDYFTVQHLNTRARFRDSARLIRDLTSAAGIEDVRRAEFFTGTDLRMMCVAWSFWNRGELEDYDGLAEDVEFAGLVSEGTGPRDRLSRLQLLLAAGIFYLNQQNHPIAHHYLQASFRASAGRASRMYPRIASGLAITAYHLGDTESADDFYRDAAAGIGAHFGPMGWQLRLATYQAMRGDRHGALSRVRAIRGSTARKSETGYNIWARILDAQLTGTLTSIGASSGLFRQAASLGMARACRTILRADSTLVGSG